MKAPLGPSLRLWQDNPASADLGTFDPLFRMLEGRSTTGLAPVKIRVQGVWLGELPTVLWLVDDPVFGTYVVMSVDPWTFDDHANVGRTSVAEVPDLQLLASDWAA